MGLTKEIWIQSITEGLFAANTFAARSLDHSEFTSGKTVHVPNAGNSPSVVKGRSQFPGTVTTRSDNDLYYSIGEYSTDPVRIPDSEKVELSYNKRESVIRNLRSSLEDSVNQDLIYSWIPSTLASGALIATTGSAETAHIATATGSRKQLTRADILSVKVLFDKQNVPQDGRCILLDAIMYNQLLASLTESQANAFLAAADAAKGVVGNLYGFDFYLRSQVAKVAADGTLKTWADTALATDSAAGIAWQEGCVSHAMGQTELFEDDNNPLYYGDILSALVRAGGCYSRYDKKGVALIYQATPEVPQNGGGESGGNDGGGTGEGGGVSA